ncbi:MAG TPA: ATP-binding cassette domain-containing protein [Bacteroidia bacterium]|nr:ATP-binding cassette domain-containing protein [Bacteroidia bacterium]
MNILNIQHVSKTYAAHKALDDVSFDVPAGSVFGLLGPNGAGKTSLIRIINQITGPDSGSILFNSDKLNKDHVQQIGYLPEERGLYRKMEVGEQCLYLAQLKGMSRSDALKKLKVWFEKFEIKAWWKKKIDELSKGMQQKVQFIVTVLHEPKLLILDEPFTGFDPINANLIKDELLKMKANGTTIVLSTHRMESVEELCSHITLINKSKKILDGSVKQIRKQFKSNIYEVRYIGHPISLANGLWGGFELLESLPEDDHNYAKIKIPDDKQTNHLLQSLTSEVQVMGFNELAPSMNDIFIKIVSEQAPSQN